MWKPPPPWLAPFLFPESCKVLEARPTEAQGSRAPSAPPPPVLPDSQDLLSLDPPPYQIPPLAATAAELSPPVPALAEAAPLGPEAEGGEAIAAVPAAHGGTDGPAGHTRGRTQKIHFARQIHLWLCQPLERLPPTHDTGNP